MTRPCQQCGRAANYAAKKRRGKVTGRNDHDLCRRCWRKLLDAANVVDRASGFRVTSRFYERDQRTGVL